MDVTPRERPARDASRVFAEETVDLKSQRGAIQVKRAWLPRSWKPAKGQAGPPAGNQLLAMAG